MKLPNIVSLILFSSILFIIPANTFGVTVKTINELNAAVKIAKPGDEIILANGNWENVHIKFNGEGTKEKPIILKAETPGKVILSGSSRMNISGSFLVVKDLILRVNAITEEGSLIELRGTSGEAKNCRLTNITIEETKQQRNSPDTKWISIHGERNRVDHCSLSGKTNSGTVLVVWLDKTPDYHLIDHNYFGPREVLGKNGAEIIRIGTSDWERHSSNCIVEYNLFEECDGEIEIISNKSVGNTYRYNTFRNCAGTLTLRHGSDCIVHSNFFFGNPEKECGGIRLIGPGHIVYNNYLENLTGTDYRAAICLANGVPNSPANRYRQVENAFVGFNTIVNCKQPFAIGAGKDDEKSLPPVNSTIVNNLVISNSKQKVVNVVDTNNNVSLKGNVTNAKTIGFPDNNGFKIIDISTSKIDELCRPDVNTADLKAVTLDFDKLTYDIDGQTRDSKSKLVGCDEPSNSEIINKPLSKSLVGANYNNIN